MRRLAGGSLVTAGALAVAALLLLLTLIPAGFWHQAETDATYKGFDRNLMYVKEAASSPASGQVHVSPDSLQITALNGSQPLAHLATTPLDRLDIQTNVRILNNPDGSTPLKLGIWSPRSSSGYFLSFSGGTTDQITTDTITDGNGGSILLGGRTVRHDGIGAYGLDRELHLHFSMDKTAGVMRFELSDADTPPSGHPMLRLVGGPSDKSYRDVESDAIPVQAGSTYSFGGQIKAVSGTDAYKVSLEWLGADNKHLSFAESWRGLAGLNGNGWTDEQFRAEAPAGATYARLYLGAGNATRVMFADLFVRREGTSQNLLPEPDFTGGGSEWSFVDGAPTTPNILSPDAATMTSTLTRSDLPDLFDSKRLSFTVSASSPGLPASAVLENYTLSLPHQRFYGVKLDDARPKFALATLLALGTLLLLLRMAPALPGWWCQMRRRLASGFTIRLTPTALAVAGAFALAVVLHGLLAGLGSHPFDMTGEKVWAYIAVDKGFADLYYLPNLVPLAEVWNGGPWHEAVFPYGPVMGWLFAGVGLADRLFLNGPGGLQSRSFGMEVTVKSMVFLFAAGDALLIYAILRAINVSQRWSTIAAAALFFNPALSVSVSIWGQTHAVSIFFLLFGIWRTLKGNPVGGWLGLTAAGLTRPQMLVPAFLLALVLLRRYPLAKNMQAVAWTVIGISLMMAPFTLTIGPSLPVDILHNQFYFQEAGGNEAAQTVVSLGSYSLWPLVTHFVAGASGADSFRYSATAHLIGPLTYQRLSELLTVAAMAIAGAAILFSRRTKEDQGWFLLPLAFGTVAFFVLKTGLAATHCLIALPFIALSVQKLKPRTWWLLMAAWSATTLVPILATLGAAFQDVPQLAPALYAGNNPVVWLFMHLGNADWFIAVGVLTNVLVLAWLAYETLFRRAGAPAVAEQPAYGRAIALDPYRRNI